MRGPWRAPVYNPSCTHIIVLPVFRELSRQQYGRRRMRDGKKFDPTVVFSVIYVLGELTLQQHVCQSPGTTTRERARAVNR